MEAWTTCRVQSTWLDARSCGACNAPATDIDCVGQVVDDLHKLLAGGRGGVHPAKPQRRLRWLRTWNQVGAPLGPIDLVQLVLASGDLLLDQLPAQQATFCWQLQQKGSIEEQPLQIGLPQALKEAPGSVEHNATFYAGLLVQQNAPKHIYGIFMESPTPVGSIICIYLTPLYP